MRISARRLALIVAAAAVVGVALHQVFNFVLATRHDEVRLEIGFVGNLVFLLVFYLCPILLVVAGVLAIRRRPATRAELIVVGVLGGLFGVLGILAAFETMIEPWSGFVEFSEASFVPFYAAPVVGGLIVLTVLAMIGIVVVQTIRAPGRATTTER